MSIAQYIKEIGRGPEGSRPLDAAQARDLLGQVLDGQVSDLEIGAFTLAMRMKGETVDELQGFCQALDARALPIAALAADRPVVVIPTYNGARKLPNLVPLLAMRLAQEGVDVLVHGPRLDPARVTTCEVFQALGLAAAENVAAVHERWARHEPAFMATEVLHPALQRLLDVRRVVGVRNSGHTVAKLLQPVHGTATLRVTSYTHPEFGALMAALAERTAANIMVLRGTEGEAVADPRRCPKMDTWLAGRLQPELSCPAQEGVLAELPILPRSTEAHAAALYVQAVAAGVQPAPAPLERQVALLMAAVSKLTQPQARRA